MNKSFSMVNVLTLSQSYKAALNTFQDLKLQLWGCQSVAEIHVLIIHFVVIKEHKACQHQQKFPQVTNWNITVSPDPWSFVPRSLVTLDWRQTRREREAVTHVPVFNLYEVTQQAVRSTTLHKALLSWPKHLWCRFTKLLCIAKAKEDKEKGKQG